MGLPLSGLPMGMVDTLSTSCWTVNASTRVIGKESDGVTRIQAEDFNEQIKTDARKGRLNLPKGRKTVLGFQKAAQNYLDRLREEGGKDLKAKKMRLGHHLNPFFKNKPLSGIHTFDAERFKKSAPQS